MPDGVPKVPVTVRAGSGGVERGAKTAPANIPASRECRFRPENGVSGEIVPLEMIDMPGFFVKTRQFHQRGTFLWNILVQGLE